MRVMANTPMPPPVVAEAIADGSEVSLRSWQKALDAGSITTYSAVGEVIDYDIVVTNPTGPSDVIGATVTDALPTDATDMTWTSMR